MYSNKIQSVLDSQKIKIGEEVVVEKKPEVENNEKTKVAEAGKDNHGA